MLRIAKKIALFSVLLLSLVYLCSGLAAKTSAVGSSGHFEEVGQLTTQRISSGIALLNDGRVLVAGGWNNPETNLAEIYNPVTKLWTATGSMITTRQIQTAPGMVTFSDGKVLTGGHQVDQTITGSVLTEIYDPSTGVWSAAGNLNVPRLHGTLLPLPGDKAILAGGSTGVGSWSNAAEIYDKSTNTWTLTGSLNIARQQDMEALALSSGKVILVGGNSGANQAENTSEIYDPNTGQWTLSTMPYTANFMALTEMADGRVFAAGSYIGSAILNDAAIYDPNTNIWTSISPMPQARSGAMAVLLDDGNILVVGGNDFSQYWYNTIIYHPTTDSWTNGPIIPTVFSSPTHIKLANGDYLFIAFNDQTTNANRSFIFTEGAGPTPTPTLTPTPTPSPTPAVVDLSPSADTYIRDGNDNRNQGGEEVMKIQSSGNNRSLVRFSQSKINSAVNGGSVIEAKLRVKIVDNSNNWGSGRTVDLHRLIKDWTEGNGTENDRGTGSGATWNCASDSDIHNQAKNCTGNTEWSMGSSSNPWVSNATDSITVHNNETGYIEYDVTSDVQAFISGLTSNYGWIIKKTNEGQNGQVSFGARESSNTPQLRITYQP